MRKLLGLACAVTALVLANSQPALAASHFPGAGWGISQVSRMTATLTVPRLDCYPGEDDAVVLGLIGPAVATLDGWNAAAVTGCFRNAQWSRVQVWVNAVGGGHKVIGASPGDVVQARLRYANTAHPKIAAINKTTDQHVTYRLMKSATTAAAGSYAGLTVPKFSTVHMNVWANHKPLHALNRAKRIEWRNSTKLMEPSGAWGDQGDNFSLYFCHR